MKSEIRHSSTFVSWMVANKQRASQSSFPQSPRWRMSGRRVRQPSCIRPAAHLCNAKQRGWRRGERFKELGRRHEFRDKNEKRCAMEVTEQSKGEQRRGISESWKNTASNARLFLSCQRRAFGVIRQSAADPGPGHWQAWPLPASCQRTAAGEAAGLLREDKASGRKR